MRLLRITKSSDYKRILQDSGRDKFVSQSFVCIGLSFAEPLDQPSVGYGYVVSKRSVGNAVLRNKCKRRLRSLATLILPQYGKQYTDYIFIARKSLIDSSFESLKKEMRRCLKKSCNKIAA